MVAEIILIPTGASGREPGKHTAQYVARGLSSIGIKVREQISLCSSRLELQKAVSTALGRSNVVVTMGGLDEDGDFMAKNVLSQGLNLQLEENPQCLRAIQSYCRRTGELYTAGDRAYALLPRGCTPFPGEYGKVAGCAISSAKQHIIMLPDSQNEAAAMLNKYVTPYLGGVQSSTTVTRTLRTYGKNAEQIRAELCELLDTANPAVTLEKDGNEVLVRVSAHGDSSHAAAALCTPVLKQLVDRLGDAAYGLDVDSLQSAVVGKLGKKQVDLAVAEAGIDGMLTRIITETPGGSDILRYSAAAESDALKTQKLGVDAKLLKKHGPVSEAAAVAMANGARKKAGARLGVAVTANTTDEKMKKCPIGLVYIAVCDANNVYVKKLVVGSGDPMERDFVIDAAVSRALNMTRLFVDCLPRAYKGAISLKDALAGKTVTDKKSYEDGPEAGEVKEGFFKRLLGNFIIRKEDEPSVKVRKVIFILAILVFLGSAGYVGKYYLDSHLAAKQAAELQEIFRYGDVDLEEVPGDYPRDYLTSFAGLWSLNQDVKAYIEIEDTQVSYPIVQSDDNDWYLRRDFYGGSNQHGIPFMDYRVDVKKPSDNIVIYGHNMKDGQIFGELESYKNTGYLEYYQEHPVIDFSTVYEKGRYKIFSVFITNAYAYDADTERLFDYHNFIDAATDEDFMKFVNQVSVRSRIRTTVDVEEGDQLLTLSTCTYEFDEARLVIVARKVRPGESDEVDVAGASVNPNPLYPEVWYRTFGGSRPTNLESATVMTPTSSSSAAAPSAPASSSAPETTTPETNSDGAPTSVPEGTQDSGSANSESSSEASQPGGLYIPSQEEAPPQSAPEPSSEPEDAPPIFSNSGQDEGTGQEEGTGGDDSGGRLNLNLSARPGATLPHKRQAPRTAAPRVVLTANGGEPSLFDYLDMDGSSSSSSGSSSGGFSSGGSSSGGSSGGSIFGRSPSSGSSSSGGYSRGSAGTVTVQAGGKQITDDAGAIVARIVQVEMGGSFNEEALKAQAVAAYTYIAFHNDKGQVPGVILAAESAVTSQVQRAVDKVMGEAVYYKNALALTPYHATSAGQTTSSASVWGGSYPYLVSVSSAVDKQTANYKVQRTMTSDEVSRKISSVMGIDTWGDPEDWFEVLSLTDGDYNGNMAVCGETKTKSGATITGRYLRENVLGLRSACFTIDYDYGTDKFTFTSYGYGHGVGMSQNGANLYATKQGWDYIQILEHYYPGCTVR